MNPNDFSNASESFKRRNPHLFSVNSHKPSNAWTKEEEDWLRNNYPNIGQHGSAVHLQRPPTSIRSKASRMGLSLDMNGEHWKSFQQRAAQTKVGKKLSKDHVDKAKSGWRRWWESLSAEERERRITESVESVKLRRTTPKGNPETLKKLWTDPDWRAKRISDASAFSKQMWADPNHKLNSDEVRQKRSDVMSKLQSSRPACNSFSNARRGLRADLGVWFRSSWEANYARYLNFLIQHEGKISRWLYEPETFWFEPIKRGVRSYKPDFKVFLNNGEIEYHEVKGWMYPRSKTAMHRMRKYHPEVRIILIDEQRYRSISKMVSHIIPNWETRKTHPFTVSGSKRE